MLENYIYDTVNLELNVIINRLQFNMKITFFMLVCISIIVYISIFISSKISMKKIDNTSLISETKEKVNIKKGKLSKIIDKIFGIEGMLAYKNIEANRRKNKVIIISITVCIIIFLCINIILPNYYNSGIYGNILQVNNNFGDYEFIIYDKDEDKIGQLINYLESNGLINDYCLFEYIESGKTELKEMSTYIEQISKEISIDNLDGKPYANTSLLCYYDEAFTNILKKAGINELNENEVVIMNTIYKYNDINGIKLKNYKVGDTCKTKIGNIEKELKIVGIIEDCMPYNTTDTNNKIVQIVSEKTMQSIVNTNNSFNNLSQYKVVINTDKKYEIETGISKIEEMFNGKIDVIKIGAYAESINTQKKISEFVMSSFIITIISIFALNAINIIYADILLRKRYFARLKAIGTSNKQINKIVILEGLFYGTKSILYASIISFIIVLMTTIYGLIIKRNIIYQITIPWIHIGLCIIFTYVVILISMLKAKKKAINSNIMDAINN